LTIENDGRIINSLRRGGLMKRFSGPRKTIAELSDSIHRTTQVCFAVRSGRMT
jgi:hypothetical protein